MVELVVPSIDFSPLGDLGKIYKESKMDYARKDALSNLGQNGEGYGKAIGSLAALGDLDGASKMAAIQKTLAPENTGALQEYKFAVSQGYKGGLLDFQKEKAAAGATRVSNNTNVNTGEKEYDKALNKDLADTFLGYQKGGRTGGDELNTISVMERAASDPNFYSGAGAGAVTAYKKGAVALGIEGADAAAPNELFGKMSNKLVVDGLGSLGAGVSNADRSFIQETVPNLQNSPEGNKKIFEVMKAVARRKQEVARLATDYARNNGGRIDYKFNDVLQDYAAKNPLFPQSGGATSQSAPAASGQVPPRRAPDGKLYVPDPNRPGKYLQVVE